VVVGHHAGLERSAAISRHRVDEISEQHRVVVGPGGLHVEPFEDGVVEIGELEQREPGRDVEQPSKMGRRNIEARLAKSAFAATT